MFTRIEREVRALKRRVRQHTDWLPQARWVHEELRTWTHDHPAESWRVSALERDLSEKIAKLEGEEQKHEEATRAGAPAFEEQRRAERERLEKAKLRSTIEPALRAYWERRWVPAVTGVALAFLIYVALFDDIGLYLALVRFTSGASGLAFLVGLIGSLALLLFWIRTDRPVLAALSGFAALLLIAVAGPAIQDAYRFHYENCWLIRASGRADSARGRTLIVECVPGKSRPSDKYEVDPDAGTVDARSCRQIDVSSSGGTIWRCRELSG